MVSWLLIAFLFVLVALIGVMIWLGSVFFLRKRLVIKIIMPAGNIKSKSFLSHGESVKVGDCEYLLRSQAELKTFWGSHIYYWYNNPEPIVFDYDKNSLKTEVNAKLVRSFTETQVIANIFRNPIIAMLTLVLAGAACAGILILLFKNFSPQACFLVPNNQTNQIIYEAAKTAIRGA